MGREWAGLLGHGCVEGSGAPVQRMGLPSKITSHQHPPCPPTPAPLTAAGDHAAGGDGAANLGAGGVDDLQRGWVEEGAWVRQLLACVHSAGGSCSTSCLTSPPTSPPPATITCLGVVASARRRLAHPGIHGHLAGAGVGAPVQVLACGGGREVGRVGTQGETSGQQQAGPVMHSMHPHNQPPLLQPAHHKGRRCGPCGRCRSRPRRSWRESRTRRGAGRRRRRARRCARPALAARGREGGREWRVCWPEVTAIDCMPATKLLQREAQQAHLQHPPTQPKPPTHLDIRAAAGAVGGGSSGARACGGAGAGLGSRASGHAGLSGGVAWLGGHVALGAGGSGGGGGREGQGLGLGAGAAAGAGGEGRHGGRRRGGRGQEGGEVGGGGEASRREGGRHEVGRSAGSRLGGHSRGLGTHRRLCLACRF